MSILSVNAGSSTLKFSLHPINRLHHAEAACLSGSIEGLEPGGHPIMTWTWQGERQSRPLIGPAPTDTSPLDANSANDPFVAALRELGALLGTLDGVPKISAIAHRVVHGGEFFVAATRVTPEVLARLATLNSLAPLHQPHNLQGIEAFGRAFPQLPQVACFDTAFHQTMPPAARAFALPQSLTTKGVRRYGFHGLSYQYIMLRLQQHSRAAHGRVVMAHLGNGASLCAALDGRSQATSMGFSALDGLIMGTRCGSLDAGVLLYLLEQGWDHARLQALLYKQSGLLGVSGVSADMRRLRADGGTGAQQAIELFTHRVIRETGAMVACINGLDVLAFSGGIGEHDAQLRADVCARLAWLGVALDDRANLGATGSSIQAVHAADSRVEVWVVPTDEGLIAAMEAARVLVSAA